MLVGNFLPVSESWDGRDGVTDAGEQGDEAEQLERFDVGDDGRDARDETLDVVYHPVGQQICRFVRLEEADFSQSENLQL